jgi:hypothetical protein
MELPEQSRYQAYLVRLWRANGDPGSPWRASAERVATGEKSVFASLSAMFEYLRQATDRSGTERGQDPQGM